MQALSISSGWAPEAVIPQAGQIGGRRLSHSHLGQHISRRRADPEAMSGECTAHIEALDLFHRRNDRGADPSTYPAGPLQERITFTPFKVGIYSRKKRAIRGAEKENVTSLG